MLARLASLVLFTCLLLQGGHCQSGDPCPSVIGEPSCVCNHPDGMGIIDARSLALQESEGPPKFKDLLDNLEYKYSFNPCYPYSQSLCNNVHICQTSNFNPDVTYAIASGGTEEMYIDPDGTPYIFYTGPGQRTVYVYLFCTSDKEPRVVAKGDEEVFFEYIFEVYSRDVCPGGKAPSGIAPGLVGILLVLFAVIGVVVYLVVGVIVMRTKYSATGTELIPNKQFWIGFPGLIKDGCLFVVSPCMNRGKSSGYSEMKS